jgi:hypothetical protein
MNRTASGDLANKWRYSIKESRNILRNHQKKYSIYRKIPAKYVLRTIQRNQCSKYSSAQL